MTDNTRAELHTPGAEAFRVSALMMRKRMGLTQAEVTRRMVALGYDIQSSAIGQMERGQRSPRLAEAEILARVYGSSVPEMMRQTWLYLGAEEAEVEEGEECQQEGCTRLATARGWCNKHYQRVRAFGDPTIKSAAQADLLAQDMPPEELEADGMCAIEGCAGRAVSRGWCNRHYKQLRRNDPDVTPEEAPEAEAAEEEPLRPLAEAQEEEFETTESRDVYRSRSGWYHVRVKMDELVLPFGFYLSEQDAAEAAQTARAQLGVR